MPFCLYGFHFCFILGIQCGFPADISNGTYKLINGTINYLSQVQYSCAEGFKMNGRDRLICDLDERWDGPPPKCTGTYSIDILIVPNNTIVYCT